MTPEDARDHVRQMVDAAAFRRLQRLADLVIRQNERQNLIARSTVETMWLRHILDSLQLIRLGSAGIGPWLDIGTGGGFPGLAIAAVTDRPMILVEPRRLRSQFLGESAQALALAHVTVVAHRVEQVDEKAVVISARAVAPIEKLLQAAGHCATPETRWLLPRGRRADGELSILERRHPSLMFHVEQSLTDSDAVIVVVDGKPSS